MPEPRPKSVRLVPRDSEIFEHILRYRLTTREVLHRLFFPEASPNAVTKVTSRLRDSGFLRQFDLYEKRQYFVFGPEAARLLGVGLKRTEELGVQTRPIEYATLAYCSAEPSRERLTRGELQEHHPELLVPGIDASRYYLDREGNNTRLASIRIDCGGTTDHVVRKCRDDLDKRLEFDAFREHVANDQYMIAIITGRPEKAAAIGQALGRHEWPIRFRIAVIPELIHLVTRFDRE